MSATYRYLTKKYIESNLLDRDENKIINKSSWNPFIYPDSGYVPQCSLCKNCYEEYMKQYEEGTKLSELLWPHLKCGCLWSEYFEDKIKNVNPQMKFKNR
jgi:hypothetical protein